MSDHAPRISVVTPAYNAEKYIGAAIESVLKQSYANWDMWIVDDCSTDNTADIASAYAEKYPNIHFIRMEKNSGDAAAPRNVALQKSQGRYVMFLDSDDMFLPQKMEKMLAFAAEKDAAIAYHSMRRISPDGKRIGHEVKVPEHIDRYGFMTTTCINMSSSMVDREKVGDVRFDADGKIKGREDLILWTQLTKDFEGHGLNDPLTLYRRGHKSVSSDIGKAASGTWDVYKEYASDMGLITRGVIYAQYALNAVRKRLIF